MLLLDPSVYATLQGSSVFFQASESVEGSCNSKGCIYVPAQKSQGFLEILVTPEKVLVSQRRTDAEGLLSILKCFKAKCYVLSLPGRVLVELPRPFALRNRLMHFPIIWDTNVF
jgi:hypothetical protein